MAGKKKFTNGIAGVRSVVHGGKEPPADKSQQSQVDPAAEVAEEVVTASMPATKKAPTKKRAPRKKAPTKTAAQTGGGKSASTAKTTKKPAAEKRKPGAAGPGQQKYSGYMSKDLFWRMKDKMKDLEMHSRRQSEFIEMAIEHFIKTGKVKK